MPFSNTAWVPLGKSTSPKRARSDSGLGFSIPPSKRTKRSLSDGDKEVAASALATLIQHSQSVSVSQPPPLRADLGYRPEHILSTASIFTENGLLHATQAPEDTSMEGVTSEMHSSDDSTARETSKPVSTTSEPTSLGSEGTTDWALDIHTKTPGPQLGVEAEDRLPDPSVFTDFLDRAPLKIKAMILDLADICPTGECFRPFYLQGMLKGYIVNNLTNRFGRPTRLDPVTEEETTRLFVVHDNIIDIPATAFVSKGFAKAYFETFYSQNRFQFWDPRAALWFFKTMGGYFSCVRKVRFMLSSGMRLTNRSHGGDLNQSLEELWYSVFCYVQHRHRFEDLQINVVGHWPMEDELRRRGSYYHVDDDMIEDTLTYREKLKHKLLRIFNVRKVDILDPGDGLFGGPNECLDVQLHMQQAPPDDLAFHKPKEKSTLAQLLSDFNEDQDTLATAAIYELGDQDLQDYFESTGAYDDAYGDAYEDEDWAHADRVGITVEDARESRLAEEDRQKRWSRNTQSFATSNGWGNSTRMSQTEQKDEELELKKQRQRSEVKASSNAIAGHLSALARNQPPPQQQPSFLRMTYDSIGNNTSGSTTNTQASSTSVNANRSYDNSSPRTYTGSRSGDVRNDSDRPHNATSSSQNNRSYGSGRRSGKYYGSRKFRSHDFWGYDE